MTSGRDADDAEFSPDFRDFIDALQKHDVDAVLVGGYALGVHGVIRPTGDIDTVDRRTKKHVQPPDSGDEGVRRAAGSCRRGRADDRRYRIPIWGAAAPDRSAKRD